VIIKEALANGRLTDQGDRDHLAALSSEAIARATTIDALAFAAALSQPWCNVALSGAVTTAQLDSNVRAVPLANELTDWPDIAESPSDYWAERSALAWQ
jgi:aryl-alcohol dehydrogenase-like predicted oxidoreductase